MNKLAFVTALVLVSTCVSPVNSAFLVDSDLVLDPPQPLDVGFIAVDGEHSPTTITMLGGRIFVEESDDQYPIWLQDSSQFVMQNGSLNADGSEAYVGLFAEDASQVTIHEGRIRGECGGMVANDDAILQLYGGYVRGGDCPAVTLNGNSHMELTGTRLHNHFYANDFSTTTITGGEIRGFSDEGSGPTMLVQNHSFVEIFGGTFHSSDSVVLTATENATVHIYGGEFQPGETMLSASGLSNVHIYGTDLSLSNNWLSGTLQDGSQLDHRVFGGSRIVLHNVPETGAGLISLFCGLVLLCGRDFRKKIHARNSN